MAKNDAILLDGVLTERARIEDLDKGEVFELFAFEQILKSYDLDRSELDFGWVDGKNDGGIDGFYTFVNGTLVTDVTQFIWPRKNVAIDVVIINCKHRDSFQQEPLNTLFPTLEELLDFSKSLSDFDGHYSSDVIRCRQIIVETFRCTAIALPKLSFRVVFASRGDRVEPNIEARGNQLKRMVLEYFSDADVVLEFLGASNLIELYRKNKFVLELPYTEQLAAEKGAYIMLVRLYDYGKFVSDERGDLRRYLFDSNVRDFLGGNRVNQDIFSSLENPCSPDFWWLNNGITILATSAVALGRTANGKALQLHDVQIVNGLQTTHTIHSYFSGERLVSDDSRSVLVKVIVSEESVIRDSIIRATNNQTSVALASLTATDKIQRDIEEILDQHQWFYERRKNYYKNIGKPIERFVDPLYLSVANVALIRKSPQLASRLKTSFMSDEKSYEAVFSEKLPIAVWPKLVEVMKIVDRGIVDNLSGVKTRARVLATWRGATALCIVSEIFGTFDYSVEELLKLDITELSPQRIGVLFKFFNETKIQSVPSKSKNSQARSEILCEQFGKENGVKGAEVIGRWELPRNPQIIYSGLKKIQSSQLATLTSFPISSEELATVLKAVPPQPWKPGMQEIVARNTGLHRKRVQRCVKSLIASGKLNQQIDGVVFDKDRVIVAIDKDRADSVYKLGDVYIPK